MHLFALCNHYRQSQRDGLRFRDLVHGRIRKTAVCSAFAHQNFHDLVDLDSSKPRLIFVDSRMAALQLALWVLVEKEGTFFKMLVGEVLWCLPRVNSWFFSATLFLKGTTPLLIGRSFSTNNITEARGFIYAQRIILKREVVPSGARFAILSRPKHAFRIV